MGMVGNYGLPPLYSGRQKFSQISDGRYRQGCVCFCPYYAGETPHFGTFAEPAIEETQLSYSQLRRPFLSLVSFYEWLSEGTDSLI